MTSLDRHTEYGDIGLSPAELGPDPILALSVWLRDAEAADVYEPNAMVLATIDPEGTPSSRTVLLKGLGAQGLDFVSNYSSRKGKALASDSHVSIVFPWYSLRRQVTIDGVATVADPAISDAYFRARPHGSKIAAIASAQSEPIESRDALDAQVRAVEARYPDVVEVPRPAGWGAYRVVPSRIEFWHGRSSRLHDRIRFTREVDGSWSVERLQP